jgi:ubiquinone/menaquinone biosynthesis C-methylase UbiE
MPSIEDNLYRDSYGWPRHGDEWTEQAEFSGVPYATWKQDLVDVFIAANIACASTVLEVGVGHGRWTPYFADRPLNYVAIDLSPSCVEHCRRKDRRQRNCSFHTTYGSNLPGELGPVDFIWSFDTFVFIEADVTAEYLEKFSRVLVAGGPACIHHSGMPTDSQRRNGWRSMVTADQFGALAVESGLRVVAQEDSSGPNGRSNARLAADCISTFEKPGQAG